MFCMKQADILCLLNCLYGSEKAASVAPRLVELIERHRGRIPVPQVTELTERDAMLITYGDLNSTDRSVSSKNIGTVL